MPKTASFVARLLDDDPGWVVIATWPDRPAEQLVGLFVSREKAEEWITSRSDDWRHQGTRDR